jgi:rifampicin phosphotransferase
MNIYTLCFREIDRTKFMLAGGKGANLGELSGIEDIQVPECFLFYQRLPRLRSILGN